MNNKRREVLVDHITSLLTYDELMDFLPLDYMKVFLLVMFLLEKYFDEIFAEEPSKEDIKLQNKIFAILDSLVVVEQEDKWLRALSYSLSACMNVC